MKKIIFITIDSLRRDHLSFFGYKRKTTPFLEKLSQNSILFEQFFSNGPNTPSAFKSIFTGTYPLFYEKYGYYPAKLPTIPKILKEKGFITIGIHNNPMLSRYYNWGMDFDIFFDFLTEEKEKRKQEVKRKLKGNRLFKILQLLYNLYKGKEKYEISLSADKLNKVALKYIKKYKSEKVFLWIHYMDAHIPYTKNKKFLKIFGKGGKIPDLGFKIANPQTMTEEELKIAIDLYDAKILYIDSEIKKLLTQLEKQNWLEDSLLIITSDHGEEFLEHGDITHRPKLYDELLKVFLLIYSAELKKEIRYDGLCNQIDIFPTILDFLNIDYKSYPTIMGKSLKDIVENKDIKFYRGIISEVANRHGEAIAEWNLRKYSYRGENWKYIRDWENDREFLFDISKDKFEKINLIDKKSKELKLFRYLIDIHEKKELESLNENRN